MTTKRLDATHGTVCRLPGEPFGYFGWPTVARLADGTLVVASSGLRSAHVCPWGKTVLNVSTDDGVTWSAPRVIQNSPIDDRDAGIADLGDGRVLVSWFTSDTRRYAAADWLPAAERSAWAEVFATWTDEMVAQHLGSWVMLSDDRGATWGAPMRAPVSAPHGPIRLRDGALLYLGKRYGTWEEMASGQITAARSDDGGATWEMLGNVPVHPGTDPANTHEPHVVELPSGRLIGMIRIQPHSGRALTVPGIPDFSMMQSTSDDGGRTWSTAQPLGFHGSPPHLLRHGSGTLLLTYGYRLAPYGQRAALSRDDGDTWDLDWIIRDDGPDGDLGYPSTVELADGSLFTVCYQKAARGEACSLLWSRWHLPREAL
jgi:sialidase-1